MKIILKIGHYLALIRVKKFKYFRVRIFLYRFIARRVYP